MTAGKHHVIIKGVKDGLNFLLDDSCELAAVLDELRHKLESTHDRILTGPIVHVHVRLGRRIVSDEEKEEIRAIIGQKGNLLIQSIESDEPEPLAGTAAPITVLKGMIRSGQTLQHDGNLLYLGDVNPGGTILCTGSIYIMGSLRGMAHAGLDGDDTAIIAASHMRPTQLRIASVISRPPDEWGFQEAFMEYACIKDGHMEIDKLNGMHRLVLA
ncbi:septum site-determining protein MinC [Paenibacillus lutrae]|uniref:Probable septum site-determining protein MinC n=1 Tax=Paenibacillus lutrae TaxID=2078573 RepID=A0A7X3FHD4_9BACL|nr:septum site-determining protein MinC [Paenibacillus lutrae]MVO99680.1 septum site-determining protein MinC [Paenibacillus lutrae]